MMLQEKLTILRQLEGNLRGLARPLAKSEVARLIKNELGESISTAYLSQLESGKRPHMTAKTRDILARFFKVHPGYLVSDPEGFRTDLVAIRTVEMDLDEWLAEAASRYSNRDPELARALGILANYEETRTAMILMGNLAEHPELMRRIHTIFEAPAVKPESPKPAKGRKKKS
ncbi:MAG: hypothetical protein K1X53_09870 [Candidatus Sumerlaeaceae bacterium]|nr:hypothetical protein [Candidatus Sumerlaeaceae bacterium]